MFASSGFAGSGLAGTFEIHSALLVYVPRYIHGAAPRGDRAPRIHVKYLREQLVFYQITHCNHHENPQAGSVSKAAVQTTLPFHLSRSSGQTIPETLVQTANFHLSTHFPDIPAEEDSALPDRSIAPESRHTLFPNLPTHTCSGIKAQNPISSAYLNSTT